jgi:hypothetical protein
MDEDDEKPREERPEDYVVLLAQVPERVSDIVAGLDEERLAYRHAPALPTLAGLAAHIAQTGTLIDALFRHILIDGATEVDLLEAIDPLAPPEVEEARGDLLERFWRDRRRTADLLRGLSPDRWADIVTDARLGEITLFEICDRVGRHEAGHLSQMRNLIALLPETLDLGPLVMRPGGG